MEGIVLLDLPQVKQYLTMFFFSDYFPVLLRTLIGYAQLKVNKMLDEPLPSTGLKNFISISCDKSTIGRNTNQAVMIMTFYGGKKIHIPVGSPLVYRTTICEVNHDEEDSCTIIGGHKDDLGNQVLDQILMFCLWNEEDLNRIICKSNLTTCIHNVICILF